MGDASTAASAARILWDVVEEHLDEAEFLLHQWRMALGSPLYTLDTLADGPEERLAAHLDGLAIGGTPVVEQLLWPRIAEGDEEEPGRVPAAALALAQVPERRWADAVIDHVGEVEDPEHRAALAIGVAASDRGDLSGKIVAALQRTPTAPGRGTWLSIVAERGALLGPGLAPLLADDDPQVRAAAVRAARFSGRAGALAAAEGALSDPDPRVAAAAAAAGTVCGSPAAWSALLTSAGTVGEAMVYAACVGEATAIDALIARLGDAALRHDVIWALGFSGRRAAADALVALLGDDEVGPLAAEAFAGITGLPVAEPWFAEPTPPDEEPPDLEDDDLAADLSESPEDDLPIPDPAAIQSWWAEHRGALDPERRYLAGRLAVGPAYADALAAATVRRRHALAIEVAIRTRGTQHLPTRVLSGLQRAPLTTLATLPNLDGMRSFSRIG